MASGPNLGENGVRATNDGLAYMCPGSLVIGTDPDFNLPWPTIRVPSALEIFRRVLNFGKYDCEISDKGRYESETISKLGGVDCAGDAFRDAGTSALFHKFLDRSPSAKDGGVLLKDQRRYLDFVAISKLLGSNEFATEIIDSYISRKILYRGFVLACRHCSSVEWFSVDEIGHTFTCRRCGNTQQYGKASWRNGNEPAWFYKLDEIVYQAVLNNSAAPILTLAAIRRSAKDSFLLCPELRISVQGDKKHRMEIDICCIPDGKLCIGEAKSNGTLATNDVSAGDAAARYRDLAEKIGATGVIFSTSTAEWDKASQSAMHATFKALPHIELLTLVAADL